MSYPAFDPSWKDWGQVSGLSVQGPHLILQIDNKREWKVFYREDLERIKLFDWVALTKNEEVVAVTSHRGSFHKTKISESNLKNWSKFQSHIRDYFDQQNFIQMFTPTLVDSAGTEPSLDPFETNLNLENSNKKKYLPTSPELSLKKALSQGHLKIYEIAKCFRNGERTRLHRPEFWMLEWYRGFASLEQIQADVVGLVKYLLQKMPSAQRPSGVQTFSIAQLFKRYCDAELTPQWGRLEYKQLCERLQLRAPDHFSLDDLFFLLMMEKIEPQLDPNKLTFVENYPPFQAALARKNETGWARRFEVYWQGMELANAFDELNDPTEQRARAIEDLHKRAERRGEKFDGVTGLDEEFFQALESGMPPSAGIALGVERLYMALMKIQNIEEIY